MFIINGADSQKWRKKPGWPAFLDEKLLERIKPKIYIIKERCKECNWCIDYCPEDILTKSDDINEKGYHPPKLKPDKSFINCSSCGFCELICPEFAIFLKIPDEASSNSNQKEEKIDE